MASITVTDTSEAVELQPLSHVGLKQASPARSGSFAGASQSIATANATTLTKVPSLSNQPPTRSNVQIVFTIAVPSLISFLASFTNGLITVGLPDIARSLSLDRALYLWPSSVYGLTCGSCLLIAGSIADIVGARPVELVGITLMGVFALSCGLANTGEQLVVFRALQGCALAMHLPSSVALISGVVPSGRPRNFGFACLGFSQPLGFGMGLVISGVMVEKSGWRSGFYLVGGAILIAAVASIWALPKLSNQRQDGIVRLCKRVGREIDWVGAVLSSAGLALLAYVLA